MPKSHKLVYAIYVVVWIIMAINPKYPQDWLLENVLVFIFFPLIFWMDKKHNYTLLSIILLLIFASLHSLGSHYTYAEMEHFNAITHFLGFERNNFDRFVHFLFGLLTFRMMFEMIASGTNTVKTALLFTFTMVVTISTQGDIWDAHKDTALAMLGALINIVFYKSYTLLWLSKRA